MGAWASDSFTHISSVQVSVFGRICASNILVVGGSATIIKKAAVATWGSLRKRASMNITVTILLEVGIVWKMAGVWIKKRTETIVLWLSTLKVNLQMWCILSKHRWGCPVYWFLVSEFSPYLCFLLPKKLPSQLKNYWEIAQYLRLRSCAFKGLSGVIRLQTE